jgi:hypothetical protein
MQNGVTIRADRAKVIDRIDLIFFSQAGKFTQMVNMNYLFAQLTVQFRHIEAARRTIETMMSDAGRPRRPIPLVSVDGNGLGSTLDVFLRGKNLFGKHRLDRTTGQCNPNPVKEAFFYVEHGVYSLMPWQMFLHFLD